LRIGVKVAIISVIIIFGSLTAITLTWPPTTKKAQSTLILLDSPVVGDEVLVSEEFLTGLNLPTKMTFIDNDILLLEKDTGFVRHITLNGTLKSKPILDLQVAKIHHSGLLGITSKDNFVYLFYTEASDQDETPIAHKVVRYLWTGSELTDPVLLKELPVNEKKSRHHGGAMTVGNDGTVYIVIGDMDHEGVLQNFPNGEPDDTGVIFPIDPSGPYYAMGIRSSYGIAVDPITGNMWDTENGDKTFDEVNFVPPKFNSGWAKIMGPSHLTHLSDIPEFDVDDLPEFDDFEYSDPEFSWQISRDSAPTAIVFPTSKRFQKYQDSLFVGDCNKGNIYRFKLNSDRTGFVFQDPSLQDLVFNPGDNDKELLFGTKYGCITDLQFGPDGYLYVVSITRGTIYKLSPETNE